MLGTYGAVIFTNKFLMRNVPKYPDYRITLFACKYALIPLLAYKVGRTLFTQQQQETLHKMSLKYQFGYNDYNKFQSMFNIK